MIATMERVRLLNWGQRAANYQIIYPWVRHILYPMDIDAITAASYKEI